MTKNPLQPIIDATWDWILERLGEDKVRELTGGLEPTHGALSLTYAKALEPQADKKVDWYSWEPISDRSANARALVERALGDALGDLIKTDHVPRQIAEAGLAIEDTKNHD